MDTYYEVLEVDENASQEEIEDAYRERVKETHPDLNDESDAADRFRKVVRAEEVLGNPDERTRYDDLGHDAYVSRVDGANAAGSEHSPWTATDEDDRGTASTGTADYWEQRTGTNGNTSARASGAGGTATASTPTEGGTTGDVGAERSRERRERYRASRHVREDATDGDASDGYSVHDWEPGSVDDQGYEFRLNQERVFLSVLVFVLYPVFVYSSVSPQFSLATNLVVGSCTFLVLAYLLTIPEIGILVFGAWSVVGPLGVVVLHTVGLFSIVGVVVVLASWVPLGYSVVFAWVTRS